MGPMWISLLAQVVIRIPATYIIAYFTRSAANPMGDPRSTFFAMLISMFVSAVATILYFKFGPWRTKGLTDQSKEARA